MKLLNVVPIIVMLSFVHAFQGSGPCRYMKRRRFRSSVAARSSTETSPPKRTTHPRNAFQGSYNMERLCSVYPPLSQYIVETTKRPTITFANPRAVRALNTALLLADYNVRSWELPEETLTPPVPGRADYIHTLADVLASSSSAKNRIPTTNVVGVDIGTGASLIYPLIGTAAYPGWSFIGTDVDRDSLQAAQRILDANHRETTISLRHQPNPRRMLQGILARSTTSTEVVDFVMCNPPFYTSQKAFQRESERKVRNLARNQRRRRRGTRVPTAPQPPPSSSNNTLNHSTATGSSNCRGVANELWYPGGEVAFVGRLITESASLFADQCLWCSSLVSRRDHVPLLQAQLRRHDARDVRVIDVGQGNKSAVLLFWSFHNRKEQRAWADRRWQG